MRLIDADELPISSIDITDVGYYVSKYGQGIPAVYWEDIQDAPTIEPEYSMDEWCKDCKEYDQERHCCPRFNRVIRTAIDDAQPEIVRCGDCKYYQTDKCYIHIERIWELTPEDYCSHGERCDLEPYQGGTS